MNWDGNMDLHTIIANLHMVQQILQARQGLEDRDVQGMLLQRVREMLVNIDARRRVLTTELATLETYTNILYSLQQQLAREFHEH
jgi:hypothetical protein